MPLLQSRHCFRNRRTMRGFLAAYQVSRTRYRAKRRDPNWNFAFDFRIRVAAATRHGSCRTGGGGSDMKSHYLSNRIGRILAALFFLASIGFVSSTAVQAQSPYPQDRDRDYRRDQDRDRDYRRDQNRDRDYDRNRSQNDDWRNRRNGGYGNNG